MAAQTSGSTLVAGGYPPQTQTTVPRPCSSQFFQCLDSISGLNNLVLVKFQEGGDLRSKNRGIVDDQYLDELIRMNPFDERDEILNVLSSSLIYIINDFLGPDQFPDIIIGFSGENNRRLAFGSYLIHNLARGRIGKVQVQHGKQKVVFAEKILFLHIL